MAHTAIVCSHFLAPIAGEVSGHGSGKVARNGTESEIVACYGIRNIARIGREMEIIAGHCSGSVAKC